MKYLFVLLPLALASVLMAREPSDESGEAVRVGYCPTMASYVGWLEDVHSVKLLAYQSSEEVLEGMLKGDVEVAVIGRKAKEEEVNSSAGYFQLNNEATTLVRDGAGEKLDPFVMFWRDVDYEKVELVTPVHADGRKVEVYRTPFVYYVDETYSDKAEEFANLIKLKKL